MKAPLSCLGLFLLGVVLGAWALACDLVRRPVVIDAVGLSVVGGLDSPTLTCDGGRKLRARARDGEIVVGCDP